MAKYGNFVGQGWMEMTLLDIYALSKELIAQCKEVFGKNYFSRFEITGDFTPYRVSDDGKKHQKVMKVLIYGYVKHPIPEYRGVCGNRVKNHTRVEFSITKDAKGWLEVPDPNNPDGYPKLRDYENCPEYQYSCMLRGDGRTIGCGCRNEEVIEPRHHFVYGTEAKDLDLRDSLRHLRSLTAVSSVKREYLEIYKRRKAA